MVKFYNSPNGLQRDVYFYDSGGSIESDVAEKGARIEEMYYDKHQGTIHLHFLSQKRIKIWECHLSQGGYMRVECSLRVNEDDSHIINIPIQASKDWNEFVESLPKWDNNE